MKMYKIRETKKGYAADLISYPTSRSKTIYLFFVVSLNIFIIIASIILVPSNTFFSILASIGISILSIIFMNTLMYILYRLESHQDCWRLYASVSLIQPLLRELYQLAAVEEIYSQNLENLLSALLNSGLEEYADSALHHFKQASDFYTQESLTEFELRASIETNSQLFFKLKSEELQGFKDIALKYNKSFSEVFAIYSEMQSQIQEKKELEKQMVLQEDLLIILKGRI